MGWASGYIERLQRGETVSFRPRGHSMSGRIESGQLCTVAPIDPGAISVDDLVLAHLISGVRLAILFLSSMSRPICVWLVKGVRSVIWLFDSSSVVIRVILASGLRSTIWLLPRFSEASFLRSARGEMSLILLPVR